MSNQIKAPIINSRTFSSRASSFADRSFSGSFEDPLTSFLPRKNTLTKNVPVLQHQSSLKNTYYLYKIDPNILPQLLEKYTQANLFYRDEEFSQQADLFLSKLAIDRKIPDEYRVKFPIYQILTCISKIFMLNEFEITLLGSMLDHLTWNVDELLSLQEASCLREFPTNLGFEIDNECKRFIVYLLAATFSLKQYAADKNDVDQIQAYCESICTNFQNIYNKWQKVSPSYNRFSFTIPEINRKFVTLMKRDIEGFQSKVKDFNMMVDEIMVLTGSYATRAKENKAGHGHAQAYVDDSKSFVSQKTQIFHDFSMPTTTEPKPMNMGMGISTPFNEDRDRGFNRSNTLESLSDFRMPSFLNNLSRQPSFNTLLQSLPLNKKVPDYDQIEDTVTKKVKTDETGERTLQHQLSLVRGNSFAKGVLQHSVSGFFKEEDIPSGFNLPMLSKSFSNISQQDGEDMPALSRFQSNLSFLYEK